MAIPNDKEQLLHAIDSTYQKLRRELSTIPVELTDRKELTGHANNTRMSINNLVAYLIGWGQLVIKWHDRTRKGLDVDFPETGYKWNELGQLAQKFYTDYEHDGFQALLALLDTTTGTIREIVATTTNTELYETARYGKWTFGRLIQLNTSSPFKNATGRIRTWKKTKQLK